jgi:hypothetical protein
MRGAVARTRLLFYLPVTEEGSAFLSPLKKRLQFFLATKKAPLRVLF